MAVELEPVALEPASRRDRRKLGPPRSQPGGNVTHGRWRRRLLAVVVVVGALGRLTGAGPAGMLHPEKPEIPVSTEIGLAPAPPAALNPLARGWRLVRKAPIASRSFALSTWTGRELLVWGGSGDLDRPKADGAAYYPDTDQWRPLPASPLLGQNGLASVWTGREWIIWGTRLAGDVPGESAAYNPETGSWRVLAPGPVRTFGGRAVWTGREMLVWDGSGGAGGAAYDPERDRWRRLARGGPDNALGGPAVWTGREMVVIGFLRSAAYDPETDRWRELPLPPLRPWFTRNVVWTGTEVIAVGGTTENGPSAEAAAYDPKSDSWRRLAPAPDAIDLGDATATWTGRLLVVARGPSRLQVYDPARDAWSEIPGLLDGPRVGSIAAWTGQEVVFWGGYGALGTPPTLEEGVAWGPSGI